jgi:EmrB/QacA subfamily drug resistance transporter
MPPQLRLSSATGRWVLLATVLGSGTASLDATVVNVALPTIARSLHATMAQLQWVVNGYTLTLAGMILLGGALGDRYGRRRVFVLGLVWFALSSALCGAAVNVDMLIAARVLQGVGGALLTPGSLAIIQASFAPGERSRAVGAWSGLGGVAGAAGPFLGGWLVSTAGWRWVFLLNLPLAAITVTVALRHVPESKDEEESGRFDVTGAVLAVLALAGITYALTSGPPGIRLAAAAAGLSCAVAFIITERRLNSAAMMPLDVFASRQFSAINAITFVVYGGLGIVMFLFVQALQVVAGFSPIKAGTALVPFTVLMLLLSARAGALAGKVGPRIPLAAGLVVAACGMLMMTRLGPGASYFTVVLPAVVVFGLGMTGVVAPLTATVLASADPRHAGVASAVNNAVARAASLLMVAAIPPLAGLTGSADTDPSRFLHGFRVSVVAGAIMVALGAVLSLLFVRDDVLRQPQAPAPECKVHCGVGSPPLDPGTLRPGSDQPA